MTIKRHKFKCLILMLGALLTLGLQPLLAQAKTTDVDSHFSVEMVETSDSKVGGEAVQVTVTNKTNQTGKNMLAKVDLPKEFADKLGKTSVTESVGTLAAGESKAFIISLSDGSTQALPTTGSSLPTTGERFASLTLIVGFILLISLGVILHKRKLTGLLLALLVVTGGSVVVDAATTHHVATHTHQVTVAGQTLTFKTQVSGDFESSDENPIPTKYTVAFDLNYDTIETVASQEVVANALATQPTVPERSGYSFEGWYEIDAGTAFDFSTPIQKDVTLYAKWEVGPIARVHFRDYGDTADVLPEQEIYAADPDLAIPAAPDKANHYFLGWAESASAAKTAMLYVPSTYTDVRSSLNGPDQSYLGYTVKTEHELTNITADTTLYAVYYKQKDAVTTDGDEFIWANAIWRNLKTDMSDTVNGNQALVIRVNALTNAEVGKGGTATDLAFVNFRGGNTYFSADGSNGYDVGVGNSNYLKGAIDYYYTNYIASNEDYVKYVQAVALHNPSYDDFKSDQSFSGSLYNGWTWSDSYKDTRFKTTLDGGGAKQAFALSHGDIHTIDGVGADDDTTTKLNFTGSNVSIFWLRSAGGNYTFAGCFVEGNFHNHYFVGSTRPVRPALSIQIN